MDILRRKVKKNCLRISVIFLLFFCGCGETNNSSITTKNQEEFLVSNEQKEKTEETSDTIFMQVDGAVMVPGVYELPANSRIAALIEAAGGLREDASRKSINQAAFVEDGQQIYVLSVEEEANKTLCDEENLAGKVNINTADKERLMSLPGVGEAKANSIILYREEHGRFSSIEELMNITGIKQGVFNKMKDQITV